MSVFSFTAQAVTRREARKGRCGEIWSGINVYTGRRMYRQQSCRIFQGSDACPSCRAQTVEREMANLSEAGSWLYWCLYPHSTKSLRWQADRKWMRRHGVRYRTCYQENGVRLLFAENRHPGIPDLQQIRIVDIDWDALMDKMPEGSSFIGNLRIPKAKTEGLPFVEVEVLFVKASDEVKVAAWDLAMEETYLLEPKTIEELQATLRKRMSAFKKELKGLGAQVATRRIEKIGVHIALVDWGAYNAIWTETKGRDPISDTSDYTTAV